MYKGIWCCRRYKRSPGGMEELPNPIARLPDQRSKGKLDPRFGKALSKTLLNPKGVLCLGPNASVSWPYCRDLRFSSAYYLSTFDLIRSDWKLAVITKTNTIYRTTCYVRLHIISLEKMKESHPGAVLGGVNSYFPRDRYPSSRHFKC